MVEVSNERFHGTIPFGRISLERLLRYFVQFPPGSLWDSRQARVKFGRPFLIVRSTRSGMLPGKHFEENNSERVHVGSAVDNTLLQPFRGSISPSTDTHFGAGVLIVGLLQFLRDSEVEYFRRSRDIDEDIGRFDIAVNDSFAVEIFNGFANAVKELQTCSERSATRPAIIHKVLTVDVLHNKEGRAVREGGGIVLGGDVGMSEICMHPDLVGEPREPRRR